MLTAEQLSKIGGSDVAAILGLSPYRKAIDIWRRIVEGATQEDTPAMRRGRILEPVVRAMYQEETGATLFGPTAFDFSGHPYLRASLDDIAERGGERRVVELKTAHWRLAQQWTDTEVPAAYAIQVQWYMRAAGLKQADLAVLFSIDDFRVQTIEADAGLQDMLLDAARCFWTDYVKPSKPPPVDGSDSYKEWLADRYPMHRTPLLQADGELELLLSDLRSHSAALEATQEQLERVRNTIKTKLGEAEGCAGAFGKLSWKATKARTDVDWEAVAAHFNPEEELINRHTTTKPGPRVFRVTWKKGSDA